MIACIALRMNHLAITLVLGLSLVGGTLFGQQEIALQNLLINGDFEEAVEGELTNETGEPTGQKVVTASGWTTLMGPTAEVITWGNDPKEAPRKGGRFLRLRDTSASEPVAIESTRVPLPKRARYAAGIWVRSQDGGDPALYMNFYKGEQRLGSKAMQAATSGPYPDWTYISLEMVPPKGAETVSIVLYSFTKDVGTYDFDDAVMGILVEGKKQPKREKEKEPEQPKAKVLRERNLPDPGPNPAASDEAATAAPAAGSAPVAASGNVAPRKQDSADPPSGLWQGSGTGPKASAGNAVSAEERDALGIEPLPVENAQPKPNSELPPPWIMPQGGTAVP